MGRTNDKRTRGAAGDQRIDERELQQLKLELVAAHERGERGTLSGMLRAHPRLVDELAHFAAALVATTGYEREALTPESIAVAERARVRALEAVFPPAPALAHPAGGLGARTAATLKALRRARGLTLSTVARRLGLGVDVLSDLEGGLIHATSVPERLCRTLGELLQTTGEQVRAALETQPMLRPALQRDRASAADVPTRDFAEAVRLSPSMSPEQKAEWTTS